MSVSPIRSPSPYGSPPPTSRLDLLHAASPDDNPTAGLSIFTPVKRSNANPLFLPSPSSTLSPTPKRKRLEQLAAARAGPSRQVEFSSPAQEPSSSIVPPPNQTHQNLLDLFDDDTPDDRNDSHRRNGRNDDDDVQVLDPLNFTATQEAQFDPAARKKRYIPKLDHERLMSNEGFPRLIENAKRLRLKGKGHEASDLTTILETYRLWAHQMFPKLNFVDTVAKVESLCHGNIMKGQMARYRDHANRANEPDEPIEVPGSPSASVQGHADSLHDIDRPHASSTVPVPAELADNPFLSPQSRSRLALQRAAHLDQIQRGNMFDQDPDELPDLDAAIARAEAEARGYAQDTPGSSSEQLQDTTRPDDMNRIDGHGGNADVDYDIPEDDDHEDDWAAMEDM